MSCGVGHRFNSDPMLLWLWCRPVTPIPPLAWKLPYAMSAAPKRPKKGGGGGRMEKAGFEARSTSVN